MLRLFLFSFFSVGVRTVANDSQLIDCSSILLSRPLVGWRVGKAEKWRSPFLGEGWRCGVSAANTAKANCLSLLVSLSFFSNLSSCAKLSTLFFFVFALLLGCARIATNVLGAWRAGGVSQRLGREANFQNPAKCSTRQRPA